MGLNDIMETQEMSRYKLAKLSNIPYATLNDLCNYKTKVAKCAVETIYKLSKNPYASFCR